jgi:hypothetical protein
MCYNEHHYSTAPDFIDAISLSRSGFYLQGKYHWMFRGQPATEDLVPSAWRPGALDSFCNGVSPNSYDNLVDVEMRVAQKFFLLADARGLEIPEDTQRLRREIWQQADRQVVAARWPPHHWLSLLALARHNGLPARLLDWSWNPYVAAYFAASGAYEALLNGSSEPTDRLEVYALNVESSHANLVRSKHGINPLPGSIEFVTAPAAGNENLRAQEGVFTLLVPKGSEANLIPSMSIEEVIRGMSRSISVILLHRFTLEAKHAWELMGLLRCEGVSASSIWPGYKGIAREIRELGEEGLGSL